MPIAGAVPRVAQRIEAAVLPRVLAALLVAVPRSVVERRPVPIAGPPIPAVPRIGVPAVPPVAAVVTAAGSGVVGHAAVRVAVTRGIPGSEALAVALAVAVVAPV